MHVLCILILLYSPLLAGYFRIENIYSNSFFRVLEFVLGMLLFVIWRDIKEKQWYHKYIANYVFEVFTLLALVIIVSILVNYDILVSNYMVYSWIGIPCFSALIFAGAGINAPKLGKSRILKYFVDISYAFFFAQYFTWKLTLKILELIKIDYNWTRIVLSFILCTVIAILMHELIEKPFRKILNKDTY